MEPRQVVKGLVHLAYYRNHEFLAHGLAMKVEASYSGSSCSGICRYAGPIDPFVNPTSAPQLV